MRDYKPSPFHSKSRQSSGEKLSGVPTDNFTFGKAFLTIAAERGECHVLGDYETFQFWQLSQRIKRLQSHGRSG